MKRFERYTESLNIDVESYLSSVTEALSSEAGGDNGEDDDGDGQGFPTVDLGKLRDVLEKHRVRSCTSLILSCSE